MKLDMLLSPIQVGPYTLKNRISYSPTLTGFASVEGEVTRLLLDYYARIARGGAGMIFIGSCSVDYPYSRNNYNPLRIDDDRFIFGLNKLAETIQRYGAVAVAQICHAGRYAKVDEPVAPSDVPGRYIDGKWIEHNIRALSTGEVEELVEKFAQAALRAKKAGFDMVDIHSGTGYIIIEFLSPHTNKRTDKYGGSFENRIRFLLEVIARIKELCGEDYPIGSTMLATDLFADGWLLEEGKALARILEKEGLVYLVGRIGIYETIWHIYRGDFKDLLPPWEYTAMVKKEVNIPVLSFLVPSDPVFMDKLLLEGKMDIVHTARPLICDPDLPMKSKEGRLEDIRVCIDCWECHERFNQAKYLGCAINPEMGLEDTECRLEKAEKPKKVIVVGGGPAGLEAARVAALRGHKVTLFEKGGTLGGQINLATLSIGKEKYKANIIDWLERQGKKAGVEIILNKDVTPATIEELKPDAVIIATGLIFTKPPIPGSDRKNVLSFADVLNKKVDFSGKKVVVIGGAEIGAENALFLAENGAAKVTIMRRGPEIGAEFNFSQKATVMGRLEQYNNVELRPGLAAHEITEEGVVAIDKNFKEVLIRADKVVIALAGSPERKLADALKGKVRQLYTIGDCNKPGKIYHAIHEGFHVGREI